MSENQTQIRHFSHEHPLSLTPESGSPTWCLVCWQDTAATMYSCTNKYCTEEFSIHRSCAELARELKHPFHPQHSLTLLAKPPYESGFFTCGACGRRSWAFSFHCSMCKFDLDVVCASLTPAKRQAPAQIQQHVRPHPHPLIPCQNEMKYELHCSGCKLPLKEGCLIYVCLHCRCLLDKSCAEWPSQIQHNLHPQHLLTLLAPVPPPVDWDWDSFPRCRACGKVLEGFTFHCSECEFDLDACCARLVPKLKNDQGNERFQIQQLSHPHPLILCVNGRGSQLACDACQCLFEDSSLIAICLVCNYLLHESCAELPREVKHPVYHQHALTLLEYSLRQSEEPFEWKKLVQSARHPSNLRRDAYMTGEMSKSGNHSGQANEFKGQFYCQACCRYTKGFAYVCLKCTFYFDIKCPSSIPLLIEFKELHQQHPLAFYGLKPTYLDCNSCQQSIDTSFFRCLECNFNLHVRCVPTLPAAKDKHHRHPLTLTDSPIRDHPDEDENAEFYCDSCEQHRELYERTYYCQECHYVAHVHCVIYEALRVLVKDPSLAITSVFEENAGKGENAEWPSQIEESPFHPQHPLTLLFLPPRNSRGCGACGKELQGITYHCSQCIFSLDLYCASLEPTKDTEFGRLSRHPHPLIFCKKEINFRRIPCCGCKRPIKGPWICVCLHCNGILDESCMELPSKMEHPFHPQHPLTLLFKPPCDLKGCRACGKELLSFSFHCSECKFTLDLFCASLKPTQPLGLTLSHPLTLCEQQNYKEITLSCYACRGGFKGSVYICLESCFLLHIYCANLPSTIDSKFCHQHSLTLLETPRNSEKTFEFNGLFQCHTCNTDTVGFAYACHQCIFYSDIKCTFRSALHEHPLVFYNVSGGLYCNVCSHILNTPFFYCKDCNFCLHVACFPILPQLVKHVAHRHPLALTHPLIKHEPAGDRWNSEFYCDACGLERDLQKPAYSCQECNFVAHVHCVADQEPSKLVKEWTLALRPYEENSVKDENRIHVPQKKRKENPETMSVKDLEGLIADAAAEREASHQIASKTRVSRTNIDINYMVRELGEKIAELAEKEKLLARELRATRSEKMQLEEKLRRMLDIRKEEARGQ